MKKRILAMTLLLALALPLGAGAIPYYDDTAYCDGYLSFSGTTAVCTISVGGSEGDSITGTMKLYQVVNGKDEFVKSWPSLKGTTSLEFTGRVYNGESGGKYKLTVSAVVNGKTIHGRDVTATCP